MYTKYFGFNEKPFTLTPNPRFIFLSKHHKEAFAHLLYGINNHYGFIELIGEVGTGKTTVLRTLLGQLQEENYRTALIFNPYLTGSELLRSINHEFGLEAKSEYANELLTELNRFLLSETENGRTVVLVIDEAQNLKPEVLEQIRLISNLETDNDKLIQIILAGQPELEALLERPDLRQLNQRIAVRYRLKSMSMNETRDYIRHRMEVAGDTGGVSFTRYAIKWIHLYTRGVPRMINILCDRALLIGYGDERRRITSTIISRGIREILNLPQAGRQRFVLFVTAVIILLLVSLSILFIKEKIIAPGKSAKAISSETTSKKEVLSGSAAIPEKTAISSQNTNKNDLQQDILFYDQQDFHIHAFNAMADTWSVRPVKIFTTNLTIPDMFSKLAAKRNLRLTGFKGTLETALSFNLPLLAATKASGNFGNYFLSITEHNGEILSIAPSLKGRNTLTTKELNQALTGSFFLVWQNKGQIPDSLESGEARFEIRTLQKLLQKAGFYKDRIDGVYSSATVQAIRDFQRSKGITDNSHPGELTIAALSIFDSQNSVPTLKRHSNK